MSGLAIIAGAGQLPKWIAEHQKREGNHYCVVNFGAQDLPWAMDHTVIEAEFERPAAMFKSLDAAGITQVCFAGGMARPKLRPLRFDTKFLKLAPKLLPAIRSGDDVALRFISDIFEGEGLEIIAAQDILTGLVAAEGVHSKVKPSDDDEADIARAVEITKTLGAADVGQAAVVAQGLCLGLETLQGTDALLSFVAQTADDLRPDPKGGKGVLYKAPKPTQTRKLDLPAIGPQTIQNAAAAGLAGVVVEAGGVMILDLEETRAVADRHGLFLVARGSRE